MSLFVLVFVCICICLSLSVSLFVFVCICLSLFVLVCRCLSLFEKREPGQDDDNDEKKRKPDQDLVSVCLFPCNVAFAVCSRAHELTKLISSFCTGLHAVIFVVGAVMQSAGFDYGCLW